MTPWRKAPTGQFYCRVTAEDGTTKILPTGTTDPLVAEDTERTAERLYQQKRWRLLDAIVHRRPRALTLFEVHNADVARPSRLDQLEAALVNAGETVDLDPLVAQWNGWGTKRRGPDPKYVRQVRRFIPAGTPFPHTQFTRKRIATFLRGLKVQEPTKNTYRAALFQFGRWLVEHEVIETNPVRDVSGFRGSEGRRIWFEPAMAETIVKAITHPVVRAMHALMAATGVEWETCEKARRRDLWLAGEGTEPWTFYARGGKNKYRTRRVAIAPAPVADLFAWARPIVADYAAGLLPVAPLFPVSEKEALDQLRAALAAVGVTGKHARATQHDWRHTFAVAMRRRLADPQDAKHQLGHAPTSIVYETVYGVYLSELGALPAPSETDEPAPVSAPTPSRSAGGHHA